MRWWSYNLGQGPLRSLGSVSNCCILFYLTRPPSLPASCLLPGRGISLLPQHPHHQLVSSQDHPPTSESSISVPAYQFLPPLPYSSLYVLPPSNHPSLPSHLLDSCRRRTLTAGEIASTITLIWFSAALCLHHITWSLPPLPYPISCTHTSKICWVYTHSATVACCLATYVLSV